jgi:hypothetical protein
MTKDKQAQRDRRDARARAAMTTRPKQGGISGMWMAIGGVIAVVVVIIGMVIYHEATKGNSSPASSAGAGSTSTVPPAVMHDVESVPASVFNTVGIGKQLAYPVAFHGHAPNVGGKPVAAYIGAEYCPYCAAERWPVVTALSRFGKFSGLKATHSSSSDVYPNTQTFSFHGSTYSSPYITFQPVETASNQPQGDSYKPLDTPNALQASMFQTYNGPPYFSQSGAIPFISYSNQYGSQGASYSPQVLAGLSMSQIASALHDPSSPVAQGVIGTANTVSAAVCAIDGGKPASVCQSPGVTAAAKKLGSG